MAIRDQIREEQQSNAATSTSAEGGAGATAKAGGDGPDDTRPRTLPQKAMYENLMEQAVASENYRTALAAVKRNAGAPGIDHMTTADLEAPASPLGENPG